MWRSGGVDNYVAVVAADDCLCVEEQTLEEGGPVRLDNDCYEIGGGDER